MKLRHLAAAFLAAFLLPAAASAASCDSLYWVPGTVRADNTGCQQLKVNSDGSINVTSSISGNPNININQVGGINTSVNTGNADAGTLRVVQAANSTVNSKITNTAASAVPTGTGYSVVTATFTRPNNTTAYATGQLFANSTTAGSVVPLAFDLSAIAAPGSTWTVVESRIRVTGLTVVMTGGLTLHTFAASPVPTVGDGGAYNASNVLASTGFATYMGQPATATNIIAFSDGSVAYAGSSASLLTIPANGIIYALIQTNGTWTPNANAVVTVELVVRP